MKFTYLLLAHVYNRCFATEYETSSQALVQPPIEMHNDDQPILYIIACNCRNAFNVEGIDLPVDINCQPQVQVVTPGANVTVWVFDAPTHSTWAGVEGFRPPPFEIHPPGMGVQLLNFRVGMQAGRILLGPNPVMFRVAPTHNLTAWNHCISMFTQYSVDEPTIRTRIGSFSDAMGSVRGFDGRQDPRDFLVQYSYHLTAVSDPTIFDHYIHVSAGNLIGGGHYESAALGDAMIMQFARSTVLVAANVGDHELSMDPDDLDAAVSSPYRPSRVTYVSANIYRKGTNTLRFPASMSYLVDESLPLSQGTPFDVNFYGVMTQDTAEYVHPRALENFEVRGDYMERLNRECLEYKHVKDGNKCILLVAGGMNPNTDPELEIEENVTEFARIVNTMTNFDGFIGSRTMAEVFLTLPDHRFVLQSRARLGKAGLVTYHRPPRYFAHPRPEPEQIEIGNPEGFTDNSPSADEIVRTLGYIYDDLANLEDEELGIFTGPIAVPDNFDYSKESGMGAVLADALRWTASEPVDIAFVECTAAIRGLEGFADKENILKSSHLIEALLRPNDYVTVRNIAGSQIWDVLEQQWTADGRFRSLSTSNLEVRYDFRRPFGSQIVEVWVGEERVSRDSEQTFSYIATDFLQGGGLGHSVLRGLGDDTAEKDRDLSQTVREIVSAYARDGAIDPPAARMLNGTIVLPRDAILQVSFPGPHPTNDQDPFEVQLHLRSRSRLLEGPFNVYLVETGEVLGQVHDINADSAAILTFRTFLTSERRLITLYTTHALWEDQSYLRELGFSVSLPPYADEASPSDTDLLGTDSNGESDYDLPTLRPSMAMRTYLSGALFTSVLIGLC